ncbi:MAG: alkaline phosphatase family protein [Janthinobacterium lividum]
MRLLAAATGFLLAAAGATTTVSAAPVLMISVDGLRPADIIDTSRGVDAPNLRRMMTAGAYATGIVGILPTLTYPSHTTLITGVAPARHGIGNNISFDPLNINQVGWQWYAADIRVPTLWSAARAGKLTTLSVHWPVSVAAPVDFNLPQIWRTGHADDRKLLGALATPGLLDSLEPSLGVYPQGIDESVEADEARVGFAVALIAAKKPALTTVYLASVDHIEHQFGPGTPEARAVIARNDAMIGRLVAAARAAEPDVTVVVVSDHGFASVTTDVNLYAPFIAAGLIGFGPEGKIARWEAEPWLMGGSAGIVLARPDDVALIAKVSTLLGKLAADPAMGIARVIDRTEVARRGGASEASFMIELKAGFETGRDPAAAKAIPSTYKGMHGYFPDRQEMGSSLFVDGPSLSRRGNLGEVDMRSIAPSVAHILGVRLDTAEMPRAF